MATSTPANKSFDIKALLTSNDMVMAAGLVLLVSIMLVPIPTILIDVLIIFNLAISLGIMLLSMYVERPLEFSIFPSLLLIVTLFRLALNVSASRQILTIGSAGQVVAAFGTIVIGGNYVVGIVIFIMLMVIQFAVINSGATRVAEVAARFTLDAMPGKQLAIDADLNSGIIDEDEAKRRRLDVQNEANFYGAMDGATKFVKGDAIAALIVILINVLGGFAIGMLQRGLDLTTALQSYALVTVGAGLAIQIPALLVSSAAGLIVTRNTAQETLGKNVVKQFSNFRMVVAVAAIIFIMGLIPGLPKVPFFLVAIILGVAAYLLWGEQQKVLPSVEELAPSGPALETPEEMMGMMVVDPVELEVGYGLLPLVDEERVDNLLHQITNIRRQILAELGFVLPVVRIRDNLRLPPQAYRIKIRGEEISRGEIFVDRYLAIQGSETDESIKGVPTVEPAFGLPALWIGEAEKGRAELTGYTVVSPLAALSTHLTEILRLRSSDLLSRQMVQEMLNQLRQKIPAAVEGLIPEMLSLGDFQDVLRNLLRERVPIRDLAGVLEVVAKHASVTRDPNVLAEAVRQTMSLTLSNMYRDQDGFLHVFTLSPMLEKTLRGALISGEGGLGFHIETDLAQAILSATGAQMEQMAQKGHLPVLLCPRELRLAFRRLVEQALPNLVVLAFSEISAGTKVKAYGMVDIPTPGSAKVSNL